MSAEGSSVKGSSQQSCTSFPKVKGEGPLFSGRGPLITGGGGGGLVNDTTPCVQHIGLEVIYLYLHVNRVGGRRGVSVMSIFMDI